MGVHVPQGEGAVSGILRHLRPHSFEDPLAKEKKERKKRKKETSVEKQNTSGHYSVWAEV